MSPLSRVEPTATPALGEDEIEAIVARLRRGEPLDDRYRARLFREPKESELVYAGKESRGAILAQTMGVPIQTLKRFGDSSGGWANKLIFGDNLQVLKTLFEMKERGLLKNGDGSTGVRLCYIDPPFATRQEFRGGQGQRAYRDKVEGARFIESLRKRLVFIRELLSDDGTLYVHLDPKKGLKGSTSPIRGLRHRYHAFSPTGGAPCCSRSCTSWSAVSSEPEVVEQRSGTSSSWCSATR